MDILDSGVRRNNVGCEFVYYFFILLITIMATQHEYQTRAFDFEIGARTHPTALRSELF